MDSPLVLAITILAGLATILFFIFGQKGLVEHWRDWQNKQKNSNAKKIRSESTQISDVPSELLLEVPLSESQARQITMIVAGANAIYNDVAKSLSAAEVAKRKVYDQRYLADSITAYVRQLESYIKEAKKGVERGNPYKDLLEYDIRDIAFFYGRSESINELLELTESNSLTILHAESGAGKTSLLKAGIRPQLLANGHVPVYINLRGSSLRAPIQRLIKLALLPEIDEYSSLLNTSLHAFLKETTSLLGKKWLVLIIDQFEEIFTRQSAELRASFVQEFADCLNDDLLSVRWILSLRGEWLSKLSTFRPYISHPFSSEYLLRSLNQMEARQAIIEPARQQGVDFDEQLVIEMLMDLGENDIYPPQLQLVCSELYKTRRKKTAISGLDYDSLGRVDGILNGYFHRVLDRNIPPAQRILAQRILIALIASDKRAIAKTKKELRTDLTAQGTDTTFLDEIISQLVDNRLLRVLESDVEKSPTYTLAHEYLVEKVELDQESMRRKVAQELIDQKMPHFERDGLLLSLDELVMIEPQKKWLNITERANELIVQSKNKIWNRHFLTLGMALSIIVVAGISALLGSMTRGFSLSISVPSEAAPSGGISISAFLWMNVFWFSIIGVMRGWAKELYIFFGVIVALGVNDLLRTFIPLIRDLPPPSTVLFAIRVIMTLLIVLLSYQFLALSLRLHYRVKNEHLQDTLFGAVLGAVNGYLIAGTGLYYFHEAWYPFPNIISPPVPGTPLADATNIMMRYMPPAWIGEPGIFFVAILILTAVSWFASNRVLRS